MPEKKPHPSTQEGAGPPLPSCSSLAPIPIDLTGACTAQGEDNNTELQAEIAAADPETTEARVESGTTVPETTETQVESGTADPDAMETEGDGQGEESDDEAFDEGRFEPPPPPTAE